MKVAVVVFATTEDPEGQARLVNALGTAQECLQTGDEVRVLFDGAGTQWPRVLDSGAHPMTDVWEKVRGQAAVCNRCASQFDAEEDILRRDLDTTEGTGHVSIRALMDEGYEVLTF